MYVYTQASIYMYIHLFTSIYIFYLHQQFYAYVACLCLCLCLCLHLYQCLYLCPCLCLRLDLCLYLCVYTHTHALISKNAGLTAANCVVHQLEGVKIKDTETKDAVLENSELAPWLDQRRPGSCSGHDNEFSLAE